MESSCKKMLSKYPELQFIKDTGKVKCSLSGHEMPCRLEVLKSYVSGKKFSKMKALHEFNFSRLEPFLFPSKKRRNQLFCALTNRYVNQKPNEVKGHVEGRRYKQAMEKYNAGELTLFQERLRKSDAAADKTITRRDGERRNSKSESSIAHVRQGDATSDIADTSPLSSGDSGEGGLWAPESDEDSDQNPLRNEDRDERPLEEERAMEEEGDASPRAKTKRKQSDRTVSNAKRRKSGSSKVKLSSRTRKTDKK